MARLFTNLFPVWVVLGGVLALLYPPLFTWFNNSAIAWGLAVVMLGMGITLSFDDFKGVMRMPAAVFVGFISHYLIMPFLGWSIAYALELPPGLAVGLILVGCCPCGTASNVVNYIGKGHVALSVTMTACSTFGAIVMTPLLTKWLAGAIVPVDAWALLLDTVKVVLAPVALGLMLHHYLPRVTRAVAPIAPGISVTAVVLIVASIIGQRAPDVRHSAGTLLLAVFLLHSCGFVLGYYFAKLCRFEPIICRTVSIEVGMQNSGLGAVLAQRNFPALPDAVIPCAISAVFHSVIGSLLAGYWRARNPPMRNGRVGGASAMLESSARASSTPAR